MNQVPVLDLTCHKDRLHFHALTFHSSQGNALSKRRKNQDDLRVFLGFGQPPLHSATEWICERWQRDGQLDLSNNLFVLPTRRSLQRLQQLLVDAAIAREILLTPPTMTTIGGLPEFLYDVENPLASDLCQQLAWCKALMQTPSWKIQELFQIESGFNIEQWQPYAKLISDLHRRLASDIWSFRSVVREVQALDRSFPELKRWEALKAIQDKYYELLSEVGLWDRQAARSVAARNGLCKTDRQVLLIGVADLNRSTRAMLEQIRDNVSVLVAAPNTSKDHFDEFGGLITEKWIEAKIQFPDDRIRVVDQAEDQAFATAHYITQLGERFSADQITIGVTDSLVEPQVCRSLNAIGVAHRNVMGVPLKETAPVQLMSAMIDYLERQDFRSYAALVRHPDFFQYVCEKTKSNSWLPKLDEYQQKGLPDRIEIGKANTFGDPESIRKRYQHQEEIADRFVETAVQLNQVHDTVSKLLKALTGKKKPIANWTDAWCNVLTKIYGKRTLNKNVPDDLRTAAACRELYIALVDKQEVPDSWKLKEPAARAMQVAIEAASESTVIEPPVTDAVELAGWLDLVLDDAPVLIVTGMNDENVPSSEHGHLFLPNSLCRDLGILDNDRRYARDAYALSVMTGVRDNLLLVVGRRDPAGEPLKPSRLLFADDNEVVARRASAFFGFHGKSDSRFWLADPTDAPELQQLPIPKPEIAQPIHSLTVTSFRDYLKCPYRFYLSRILRLETDVVELQELDGGAFGTLIHDVLEDFGKSELRDSENADEIFAYLSERLYFRERLNYGGSRLPAVRVQIEQIKLRLRQFAPLQAQRAADGWRILSTEQYVEHAMLVDDEPFVIRGTIDRIDFHDAMGTVEIWDYKSADGGESPDRKHRNKQGWIDLQLPLYRHLAKEVTALAEHDIESARLGYVVLPRELDKCRFELANWSSEQLQQADDEARRIIRQVRSSRFWPPNRQPPEFSEQFGGICQDNVFERFATEVAQ